MHTSDDYWRIFHIMNEKKRYKYRMRNIITEKLWIIKEWGKIMGKWWLVFEIPTSNIKMWFYYKQECKKNGFISPKTQWVWGIYYSSFRGVARVIMAIIPIIKFDVYKCNPRTFAFIDTIYSLFRISLICFYYEFWDKWQLVCEFIVWFDQQLTKRL